MLVLRSFASPSGEEREIVTLPGIGGSRLVVDRRTADSADARLLAHLSVDEPPENADLVADMYVSDANRACRSLSADDRAAHPAAPAHHPAPNSRAALVDRAGRSYRIAAHGRRLPRQMRWQRAAPGAPACGVSLRAVVGALESYEPALALTRAAIARHRGDDAVSISSLALELRRLEASPIVLNRRLREAVVAHVSRRDVSLSAIALACGRVKRDRRGRIAGETSWLGRRVGLLADSDTRVCNPWVHSDVLALIARDGLGIDPREVELG